MMYRGSEWVFIPSLVSKEAIKTLTSSVWPISFPIWTILSELWVFSEFDPTSYPVSKTRT